MKLTSKLNIIAATLLGAALAPNALEAGGLDLYEIGTPDVGLASAGYGSRVQDAATVFRNPAGMSFLDGAQFGVGAQLTYGSVAFTPNGNTSPRLGTDGGGNAIGALPAGGLFLSIPLSEKLSLGFASLSYFGLMEKYHDDWVGRYYIQEGTTLGFSLLPTVSFKPTDWLSVGAGLNAMYGYLKTKVAVNNLDPALADGQLSIKDSTWGFGANAGVLVEPKQGTRLGLTYLSPVKLDFKDTPSFSNLGPGLAALLSGRSELNLGMTVPQSAMLSLYQELSPRWALVADFGWQNWKQFGNVDVSVEGTALVRTVNANYQDTWHGALGALYQLNEKWMLTGGVAYDSSAVDSAHRTVTLPMGQAWRFGVGALYQLNQRARLGLAYEYLWSGTMPVDQGSDASVRGRVSGAYVDSWFSFASLTLNWSF